MRVLGGAQEITDRYAADEALRASERRFRLLAENARDLIFRLAFLPEPHYEYVSPASVAITGYTPEELYESTGTWLRSLPARHGTDGRLLNQRGLSEPLDVGVPEERDRHLGEPAAHVRERRLGPCGRGRRNYSRPQHRAQAVRRSWPRGLHDGLTGLPNRLASPRSRGAGTHTCAPRAISVIVVALDLDDFTLLNDTHGHDTGDTVLVAVAERFAPGGRSRTVARTGSDEFVVIGDQDRRSDEGRPRCSSSALGCVPAPGPHGGRGVRPRPHRRDRRSPIRDSREPSSATLISRAPRKEQRSGTGVEFFNADMRTRTLERFELVTDLHRALERTSSRFSTNRSCVSPTAGTSAPRHSSVGGIPCAGWSNPATSFRWRRTSA